MFLESMRPFKLTHIGGTDRLQVPADALSRLHVANLRARHAREQKEWRERLERRVAEARKQGGGAAAVDEAADIVDHI